MREEGLEVVYNRRRRRWSSYAGEVSAAPPNLVARDFSAPAPDELWVTDITEFRIPAGKAYLSAVVDCFDGRPAGWRIGPSPTAALANGSLADAVAARRAGARTVVHSDRGGHYRWPGWVALCRGGRPGPLHVRKGCSPDNAACEGFFGRLKNRVLPLQGLGGRARGRVRPPARRLPALLLLGQDQEVPGVAEPRRVPRVARLRRLGGTKKRPHPRFTHKNRTNAWFLRQKSYSLDFRLSTMSIWASLGRMTSMTTAVNTMVRTKAMTKLSQ